MKKSWIAGRRADPATVKFRLIGLAHAGGGSTLFAPWRGAFGPEVEVCPVVLPGREARMGEAPYRSMEALIGPLMEALLPELDVPFALFGHSMGSIVAFEVARRAEALGLPLRQLLVSGRRAPHLRSRRPPVHAMENDAFLAAIGSLGGTPPQVLQDEQLFRTFMPSLRADFELNERYTPLTGRTLLCDMAAFMGRDDTEVSETELMAWREVTAGRFSHSVLEGNHFYLLDQPQRLLALLGRHLKSARDDRAVVID
ncbi:thioesterase II family protein [Pseudoduganella buxea]|uniref:Thioesterase n=1 Tax=Pseudoduganella buxea TaxID=1949069 RepID=A0ABQ1KCK6_9BURK|nr:alpha/beta fold hydrolase [Pseudoduganella buxea]GGB95629.1 thioesterase [Pseudoduganella buxea]